MPTSTGNAEEAEAKATTTRSRSFRRRPSPRAYAKEMHHPHPKLNASFSEIVREFRAERQDCTGVTGQHRLEYSLDVRHTLAGISARHGERSRAHLLLKNEKKRKEEKLLSCSAVQFWF